MRAKYARKIRDGIVTARLFCEARALGGHFAAFGLQLGFQQSRSPLAIRAFDRIVERTSRDVLPGGE